MGNEKSQETNLNVSSHSIFAIKLLSNQASTGYSWALFNKPDSVALLDISIESTHSHLVGDTSFQVFTFFALEPDKSTIKFKLLRRWEPDKVVDERVFNLTIIDDDNDDLEKVAGCHRYVSYSDVQGLTPVTVLYMAPHEGNIAPLYRAPSITSDSKKDK